MTGRSKESAKELRQRAEEKSRGDEQIVRDSDRETLTPVDAQLILHELRVHQIELEMQNDELRRTQADLDTQRARYFDLYDLAPVGYLTFGESGLIQEANLTAATMLGEVRSLLLKRPLSQYIYPADQDAYFVHRKRGFDSGERQNFELRLQRADGVVFWADLRTSFVPDGAFMVTLSDITDRKQLEKNLQSAYQQLKETQGLLIEQEKQATICQMAAGVAHEINNPLSFIRSNLSSLGNYIDKIVSCLDLAQTREKVLSPKSGCFEADCQARIDSIVPDLRDLIQESQEGINRVVKIVQDLVAFARPAPAASGPMNLNACLKNSLKLVEDDLAHATVEHSFGDLPLIMGDSAQLSLVFVNLLQNAAHAISGQGTIRVGTWQEEGLVCVAITDSGTGIPTAILPQIFEPFFTTREAGTGTGLGLAVCRDIVQQLGGTITVASSVGVGSTFTVRLPLTPQMAVAENSAAPRVLTGDSHG